MCAHENRTNFGTDHFGDSSMPSCASRAHRNATQEPYFAYGRRRAWICSVLALAMAFVQPVIGQTQKRVRTYKNNSGVLQADSFHLQAYLDNAPNPARGQLVHVATVNPANNNNVFMPALDVNAPTLDLIPGTLVNAVAAGQSMRVTADMKPSINGGGLGLDPPPGSFFSRTVPDMPSQKIPTSSVAAAIELMRFNPDTALVRITNDYGEDMFLTDLEVRQGNTTDINIPGEYSPDGILVHSSTSVSLTVGSIWEVSFPMLEPNRPISVYFSAAKMSDLSDQYLQGAVGVVPEPGLGPAILMVCIGSMLLCRRHCGVSTY